VKNNHEDFNERIKNTYEVLNENITRIETDMKEEMQK